MKTIKENKTNEIIIKNSSFITSLIKIDENFSLNDYLKAAKSKYPDATHYCYAYITTLSQKSSDDGEPGGTAGLPMLNVLLKNDLINVLAITIRYFGGIKLGAGGLVRAYTKSLTEALKKCQIVTIEKGLEIVLTINYDMQKSLEYLLKDCEIVEKNYQEQITYRINIKKSYLEKLKQYNPVIIKETYIEKKS